MGLQRERVAMEVLLEPDETQTLLDVLRSYSSDLRMEIVDTDNPIYKRPLKHQREVIDTIVGKLSSATAKDEQGADSSAESQSDDAGTSSQRVALRIVAVW